jgi:hypothetical protein
MNLKKEEISDTIIPCGPLVWILDNNNYYMLNFIARYIQRLLVLKPKIA